MGVSNRGGQEGPRGAIFSGGPARLPILPSRTSSGVAGPAEARAAGFSSANPAFFGLIALAILVLWIFQCV